MKASKSFSLDIEVIQEIQKRGYGSTWINCKMRKILNLPDTEECKKLMGDKNGE